MNRISFIHGLCDSVIFTITAASYTICSPDGSAPERNYVMAGNVSIVHNRNCGNIDIVFGAVCSKTNQAWELYS